MSFKQDTELENLCLVNLYKARALFWFTYVFYWYRSQSNVAFSIYHLIYAQIKSVYLVCHDSCGQRNGNSIFYIICKQI